MELKHIKIFAIVLIILFAANITYSGPRKKLGTSAAPELLIPVGSVGTSLSGSNLSSITGVDALYWNPAGLAKLDANYAEVMFSHMTYFADMSVGYLAAGTKIGNLGNLGVSIKSLSVGDIMETTELMPEGTGQVFNPTYLVANIGFAKQMTDRIRFGTNIKLISENVANVTSTGFGFDFGIQYIAGQTGISFGIALKNLGPSMTFNGPGLDRVIEINGKKYTQRVILQSFDLPTNLELGVGYNLRLTDKMNLNFSGAFQNSSFSSDEYRFGLEYNYNNMFYIRGAGNYLPDKDSGESLFGPTFGAGLKYPFGSFTLGFDYAYRILNEEGFDSSNQFFTINIGF